MHTIFAVVGLQALEKAVWIRMHVTPYDSILCYDQIRIYEGWMVIHGMSGRRLGPVHFRHLRSVTELIDVSEEH